MSVLIEPSIAEAESIVKGAVSQRKTLLIIGRCWVQYIGRAKSNLEPGERILIIKEDGSILVHRPVGYEPVNWQPPGCLFQVQAAHEALQVRAVRQNPAESVKVSFDKIRVVFAMNLADSGEFSLHASETDMQKALLLMPSLLEDGFKPTSYEKKVEPGFVDVYGTDMNGRLVVVEIKRKTAGKGAAFQLARYIDTVRSRADRQVRGVLMAPNIAKGVQRILVSLGLEFKPLDPKKCAEVLVRSETKKLAEFFT